MATPRPSTLTPVVALLLVSAAWAGAASAQSVEDPTGSACLAVDGDACTGTVADGDGEAIVTEDGGEVCFEPWRTSPNPEAGVEEGGG